MFRRYEEAFAAGTEAPVTDPSEADSGIFAESDRIEREGKMVKVFRNGKFVEVPAFFKDKLAILKCLPKFLNFLFR